MKPSLEQIDLLLGESLELIETAAKEIKELPSQELKDKLINIGQATGEIWEVRNQIHTLKPEIKRDYIVEHTEDKQRFESLNKINLKALKYESEGKHDEAQNIYSDLLRKSKYGYFKLLAEAGLYRVTNRYDDKI